MIFSLVVIALLSACRNEFDFEEHYSGGEIKKEYADNWVKQMGPIDPEQDWCMAGEYSVTVTVPGEEDVKVYALNPEGEYRLVGEYFGVSGTQTLKFDAIKGTKDLLVSTSQGFKKAVIDGEVGFEVGTRAVYTGTSNDVNVSLEYDKDYIYDKLTLHAVLNQCNTLLSGYGRNGNPDYLFFPQSSSVYIYPIYWNPSEKGTDVIGIYYYNTKGQMNMIPVYDTDGGTYLAEGDNKNGPWKNCSGGNSGSGKNFYKSQAIKVDLPSDCSSFGIYIKNDERWFTYYSQSSKNTIKFTKCGTYTYQGKSYVYMGDGAGSGIQNAILYIDGAAPVNDIMTKWCVACEDLGDTGDYDFNDLVFMFEKRSEKKSTFSSTTYLLNITPLAAGGTLKAYYSFDGTVINEIHAAFELDESNSEKCSMINTNAPRGEGVDGIKAQMYTKDYKTTNFSMSQALQGLKISVGVEDAIIISAPKKGEAPQMIIVPDSWQWPSERTSILDAYPNFTDWSSDKTNTDWSSHKAYDPDRVFFYYAPNK